MLVPAWAWPLFGDPSETLPTPAPPQVHTVQTLQKQAEIHVLSPGSWQSGGADVSPRRPQEDFLEGLSSQGSPPEGSRGHPRKAARALGQALQLAWELSCLPTDTAPRGDREGCHTLYPLTPSLPCPILSKIPTSPVLPWAVGMERNVSLSPGCVTGPCLIWS